MIKKKYLTSFFILALGFVGGDVMYAQSAQVQEQLARLREAVDASKAARQPIGQPRQTLGDPPPISVGLTPPRSTALRQIPENVSPVGQPPAQVPVVNVAEQTPAGELGSDLHQQAFVGASNSLLPMTPDQIRALHSLFDSVQRAAAEHPGIPPLPTSSSINVRLEPGSTPPVIRLSSGLVTSLVFVDSTGAPWPIKSYSNGNPKAFNIQWNQKSNLLMIQPLTAYKVGNLALVLKDLNTPIMLTFMPGQKAVDYRVDLHVPGLGPNAKPDIMGLPGTESPLLLSVLNGVPPKGSKRLSVANCPQCELWQLKKRFYFRTQFTLLSPGWISKISSSDGTNAYELNRTPVLLVSKRGKSFTLIVKGL